MKIIKTLLIIVVTILVVVAIAGIIKFNILQDDIYIKNADGTVEKYDEAKQENQEYYSKVMLKLFSIKTTSDLIVNVPEENIVTKIIEFVSIDSTTEMAKGDYSDGTERGTIFFDYMKIKILNIGESTDSLYFVAPFIVSNQGSGRFYYLGLFGYHVNSFKIKHLDSYFLGDRIELSSIKEEKNILEVYFKIHSDKQSMAEKPNMSKQLKIKVNSTKFQKEN